MKNKIKNCENFSLEVKLLKNTIQKVNDNAYFIIDLPSFIGTIVTYDHTIANQTICHHGNISEEVIEEASPEDNQKEIK